MPRNITRPRLLAAAARAGAGLYRRDRDLPRLGLGAARRGGAALVAALRSAEADCEDQRRAGSVTYSLERHVGLLAALFAEMKTARA